MKIEKNAKLLMIGDSITDANRTKPAGEGLFDALGKGYVSLVDAFLTASAPATRHPRGQPRHRRQHACATSRRAGNQDVTAHRPDWLSIMIGINDVWRQFDTPLQTDWQVPPEEYAATLGRTRRADAALPSRAWS